VTDLSTRELAHHIVRNTDPWADADAIRVATAYLELLAESSVVRAIADELDAGHPDDPADA
jgi:hypothetical protein